MTLISSMCITLEPILYSTAAFIFITSIIAWAKRKRLEERERFGIEFPLKLPGWGDSAGDRILSVILTLVILGAMGTLGYVIATPKVGVAFTEFYLLGVEGEAIDYPGELKVGEEGRMMVGITNHEGETVTYRVEVMMNGELNNKVAPIMLDNEQRWQETVSFTPSMAGDNQKVEFLLYQGEEDEPYLEPLYLWVKVGE